MSGALWAAFGVGVLVGANVTLYACRRYVERAAARRTVAEAEAYTRSDTPS